MSAHPCPAFRIGVLLSGTLIAEHVLRERRPFSIGQSTRTTVCLPIEALPRQWDLLTIVDGGVVLRLAPGMEARVSIGDELLTRAALDARGTVEKGVTTVTLPMTARGRIELPELRVLFQGVQLAHVAKPVLPRALKGTLADRIDGRIAVLAAASIVAHVGLMVVASLHDAPADVTMAKRATEQYRDDTIAIIDADDPLLSMPEPTEAPAETPPDAPAVAKPATPSSPDPSRPTPVRPAPPRPIEPGSLDAPGDATRMADMLFAPDEIGAGGLDLSARKPGSDLAKQLQEVVDSGANTSIGDGTTQRPIDDRGPRPGTIQGPIIDGTPAVIGPTPPKQEVVPPFTIGKPKPQPKPGDPDVGTIVEKIHKVYMGGLQRCYKKSLLDDPKLSGKLVITFTVDERGKVSDAGASGMDDEKLDRCVEGLMGGWSFTPVKDGDGDPTEADLKMSLAMTPH